MRPFPAFSSEAFTLNGEHNGIVKDTVQSTEKRIAFAEVFLPLRRISVAGSVAGKDHVVTPFFLVSAVNQVKEQPSVLLVKLTVPNLINDQAGRAHKRSQQNAFPACTASICHSVTQLRHLNEVSLLPLFTAGTAKSLSQMRLSGSGFPNKSEILVGIQGRKRRQAP